MNRILAVVALGCLGLSACEEKISGDPPDAPGPPASQAKPVYTPTPWQEPEFMKRDAGHRPMNSNP
jgi:hypothetical protein